MSLSAHPSRALERGSVRRVEIATLIAISVHAVAFWLAPPYVARPYHLEAAPLRLVATGAFGSGGASVGSGAPASQPIPVPTTTRSPSIVTEQLRISSQAAPESSPSRSVAGTGPGAPGGSVSGTGTGDGGTDDSAPPVFYAFDSPPQVVTRMVPEYPLAARVAGAEGTVVLNANVDAQGRIMRVWVARSTAPEALVESAMDALYRFRFSPGSQQGIPVPCTVAVPFDFRLNVHVETTGGQHER